VFRVCFGVRNGSGLDEKGTSASHCLHAARRVQRVTRAALRVTKRALLDMRLVGDELRDVPAQVEIESKN